MLRFVDVQKPGPVSEISYNVRVFIFFLGVRLALTWIFYELNTVTNESRINYGFEAYVKLQTDMSPSTFHVPGNPHEQPPVCQVVDL